MTSALKVRLPFALLGLATAALSGCGPVQSTECKQYLECQAAIDTEAGTSTADGLTVSYGESGTCWSSTAEAAESCTNACIDALDAIYASYPEVQACAPAAAE
ncbi:MAG: hypothetical protein ACO3JL_00170 [Myxococcota bacterium]